MAALAGTIAALEEVPSYHCSGVWVLWGQPRRWEIWYATGKHREDLGPKTTVDDGRRQRSHKAGTAVVFVDRSHLAEGSENGSIFQPGRFLRRIEEMSRRPGWFVRIEKGKERTAQGLDLERFEISMTMDQRVHPTHNERGKITLVVDPSTRLPTRWVLYDWQEGRWQLRQRVDQVEYNLAIPERVFDLKLPAGTRTVDVDWSKRTHALLAAEKASDGREVVLRAIDLTAEGDVMVSVANQKEGQGLQPPTLSVVWLQAKDDLGRVYVDAGYNYIAPTFAMAWLVPLVPQQAQDPLPRRLTVSAELANGETVDFRGLPAPPPAYETVREMPPYYDTPMTAQEVEKIRAKARAAAPRRFGWARTLQRAGNQGRLRQSPDRGSSEPAAR
jgi:hypothetical protein